MNKRTNEPQNGVNRSLKVRSWVLLGLFLVLGCGLLIWRLYTWQIVRHDEMLSAAASQQMKDMTITPQRGQIYDATGKVLAKSSIVWTITADPSLIKAPSLSKEELEAIAAEYGDDRRTVLEAPDNAQAQLTEEPPAAEEAVVAFTYGGQLKRMSPQLYRKTPLETAEDAAERPRFLFQTDTEETLLFFTNLGNCYSLRVDALTEIKPKDRGNLLTGVLAGLESGEAPLWITCCRPAQLAKEPDLLFVTRRGMVKRTAAADYDVRSKKFAAVNLKAGDSLLTVLPAFTQDDLLMFTRAGMCIRFGLDTVPVQGRISAGVRGMQVDEEDELIWCGQVGENDEMILFSERGYGKRILSCDFEKQNRNGKGVKSFYFNKSGSNGKYLAGLYLAGKGPCRLTIHQAQSPDTALNKDEIRLQSKTDRGVPYVMAVLEDVVTGLTGQEES